MSFAEVAAQRDVTTPVAWEQSCAHVAMKRRMWPIAYPCDMPMLQRINVAVLNMTRVIGLVAYQVFPEPTLPDSAFVARDTNVAELFVLWKHSCETVLDQPPACGEIGIA
ncbi:hypothetical protein QU42_14535 [Bradyrhizobium sp. UASWS1016]|nr:hypothetical protein QU41_24930 [Bradyrhizobium elkanii]OCX30241.1 hypothetical protein QU42_14535 [Bradyrhizobium sp. UASWS1016]